MCAHLHREQLHKNRVVRRPPPADCVEMADFVRTADCLVGVYRHSFAVFSSASYWASVVAVPQGILVLWCGTVIFSPVTHAPIPAFFCPSTFCTLERSSLWNADCWFPWLSLKSCSMHLEQQSFQTTATVVLGQGTGRSEQYRQWSERCLLQ